MKFILKLLEYGFKEACDSDGIYMVLKKQRRWDGFEYRWAVGRQQATIEQEVVCRSVAYPEIFFGGVQQIQLTEGRENRDLGAVAPQSGVLPNFQVGETCILIRF
jgi:hypothetical protein